MKHYNEITRLVERRRELHHAASGPTAREMGLVLAPGAYISREVIANLKWLKPVQLQNEPPSQRLLAVMNRAFNVARNLDARHAHCTITHDTNHLEISGFAPFPQALIFAFNGIINPASMAATSMEYPTLRISLPDAAIKQMLTLRLGATHEGVLCIFVDTQG